MDMAKTIEYKIFECAKLNAQRKSISKIWQVKPIQVNSAKSLQQFQKKEFNISYQQDLKQQSL
ncbi:hypothetical protein BB561_002527 [Smittium simulii]|uniref:Uncharacterized protein n=1 Tax=Smittium simulii TaxID=133385 RepID=A0A2T9YQ81_9FUNG|nr:hypothetical protein BB561_002527 [Smittium simulii]